MSYPLPENETKRLAALDRLQIVGTSPTADFDSVLALALQSSRCPSGSIGFLDGDTHWFKAEVGMGCRDLPRHLSLANYALLQTDPFIVEDLAKDARFCDSFALKERGIRFYAGIALNIECGLKVGALCLTDTRPHKVAAALIETLRHIGKIIESLLTAHMQVQKAAGLAASAQASEHDLWQKTRLIAQSERLAKVGAWEMDLDTKIFHFSDEIAKIHEMEPGEILTMEDVRARMVPELRVHAEGLFQRCLQTGQGYEYRGEFVTRRGTHRWGHVIAEAVQRDGRVVRIFGTVRDVTEEHLAEQKLWRSAHYDALTEIPNRHYWTMRLDEAFARATAQKAGLTILMFDLDSFKEINDTHGHAIGDMVLFNVARRMSETLPKDAFHARLGGDEFAIMLEGSYSDRDIENLVRALLAAIQRPIVVNKMRLHVAGTFACASFPADAASVSELMQKVDMALYQAKRSHRCSFVQFRPEIADLFSNKRHAIELVSAAIEQNRLVPFYQPKINVKTGQPVGFEALCRIEAADGTILGPSQFLPALQDPATSARIGTVMLDLVTADIAIWLADGLTPGRVAFNVAGSDFANSDLDQRVLARLAALGLPATTLEIEVTENTILGKDALAVSEALQAMHDQGIIITLDDFGTGYASLTHLCDAPIHYIKLDRSFIAGLNRGGDSAIIVKSMVDLGHSLNMRVVGEGVETQAQADFLYAIGCDEAQGFLYGRPVSRAATRIILENRERWERWDSESALVNG